MSFSQRHDAGSPLRAVDPSSSSLNPSTEVQLRREFLELLKPRLDGPSDSALALSARSLSEIVGSGLPQTSISLDDARSSACLSVGGYRAFPIFVAPGYHNFAAVFNRTRLEESFPDYFPPAFSKIRGSVGEAVRNVGQHGVRLDDRHHALQDGEALFASAALFVKELCFSTSRGVSFRALMTVVTDEGCGMPNPQYSMLDGVGNGEDHEGMGIELRDSLMYLVKDTHGEWSLFDGLRSVVPTQYVSEGSFHPRAIRRDEKVPRLCAVDLPGPSRGCQKVAVYPHPDMNRDDAPEVQALLIAALRG